VRLPVSHIVVKSLSAPTQFKMEQAINIDRKLAVEITYPQQIVQLSKKVNYRAFRIIAYQWTTPLTPVYNNMEIRLDNHEGQIEHIQSRNSNMADPSVIVSYPIWVQFTAVPAESTIIYDAPTNAAVSYVSRASNGTIIPIENNNFVFSIWLDGALATTAVVNKTTPVQLIIEFL